jgi:type IV pilus assembly protein PilA
MFKKIRNKKGFTLIELMIVVAIVGILAAIAIPAYIDYTIKAKLSEVANAYDALATAASEYHASMGVWPQYDGSSTALALSQLVALPDRRAAFQYISNTAAATIYQANICNIATAVDSYILEMTITYDSATGYTKAWTGGTNLAAKYQPRM